MGKELDVILKQFAVVHLCVLLRENNIFQLNVIDFKFPRATDLQISDDNFTKHVLLMSSQVARALGFLK